MRPRPRRPTPAQRAETRRLVAILRVQEVRRIVEAGLRLMAEPEPDLARAAALEARMEALARAPWG